MVYRQLQTSEFTLQNRIFKVRITTRQMTGSEGTDKHKTSGKKDLCCITVHGFGSRIWRDLGNDPRAVKEWQSHASKVLRDGAYESCV